MADEADEEGGDGGTTAAEVVEELERLESSVSSPEERRIASRIRSLGAGLYGLERRAVGGVGEHIRSYTTRDVAEAFVGSTLFSLPLVVEGGVLDIGEHFATGFVYGLPVYFLGNVAFVTVVTAGLLYYAEFRDVEVTYLFGVVPRRLTGVLTIAFLMAAATMALWGRLDASRPFLTVCRVSVVWTAGSFGAGLGDILPGESEGADLGDVLDRFD
ncbi:hypothetical protein [Natronomonas marina]|uniref:hypothetical protein n=1 Tax=Natronomonas marina TaxID=2961939 RepID=UPI0020C941B7|nr:hypothetical protein [Natronomonas marina]